MTAKNNSKNIYMMDVPYFLSQARKENKEIPEQDFEKINYDIGLMEIILTFPEQWKDFQKVVPIWHIPITDALNWLYAFSKQNAGTVINPVTITDVRRDGQNFIEFIV